MDLRGRTVVVTGASSGTGAAAVRRLHRLGARVVVIGRDPVRTRAVAAEVAAPCFTADFADLAQVRRLGEELREAAPRIDVLADNAGGALRAATPTIDGNEPNYQVNALAPLLLITMLTPALQAVGGRIVSTSSRSHRGEHLDVDHVGAQLDDPTGLSAHRRYARAKLAALLLHREHARQNPQLSIVDFHPGIVATDFGRYLGVGGSVAKVLARPFLTSPDRAAARLVHLATTEAPLGGRYVDRDHLAPPSPLVDDQRLAAAVWADACRRLG